MKLCIIGTGYVGLVTGTCFAEFGNDVWCVDNNEKKIKALNQEQIPIYEPGLEEMVKRNYQAGRIKFTTSLEEALKDSLLVFIAVGTPPDEDGSADLSYVLMAAEEIGKKMNESKIIVNKSTVPVGTAGKVRKVICEELCLRDLGNLEFDIVSNPEFLKEGAAIEDFMRPDRIIIGTENIRTAEIMKELYNPFVRNGHPILIMDIPSAELTKYAANAMLATRISFMNEIANICEAVGADIENIRKGIGSDSRIGMPFLYAGLGYGGSCFPKDVKALIKIFQEQIGEAHILQAVEAVNMKRKSKIIEMVTSYFGENLSNLTFTVWGLSFKPQTDDMREAPSITTIEGLIARGATVKAHDPVAISVAREILGEKEITYWDNHYVALEGSNALLLLTEWPLYKHPDFDKIRKLMKEPNVFDGRNQYDGKQLVKKGFKYFGIGRQ